MPFAFIGSESDWRLFSAHSSDFAGRTLAAILPDPAAPAWTNWPAGARRYDDFETLLADASMHALVLAGPMASRADRLRRAAQAGRSCLCFHPADLSTAVYHEIAMIAGDTGARLVPLLPGRIHAAWRRLRALVASDTLGRLVNVRVDRTGAVPAGHALLAAGYSEVADLIVTLLGDIAELTATGDIDAGRLVVMHRAHSGATAEVRLRVEPTSRDAWLVVAEFDRGRAELELANGLTGAATLRHAVAGQAETIEQFGSGLIAPLLDALDPIAPHDSSLPTWSDATRAAELAESAGYSLKRRRSVDIFEEKRDELASFKGMMTSFGCGLIWFTLLALIVVAAGKGLGLPGMDWLAAGVAFVWLVFLGAQALRWVFPTQNG